MDPPVRREAPVDRPVPLLLCSTDPERGARRLRTANGMGRGRKWRVVHEAPDRCPVHQKSVHNGSGPALVAARAVEVKEGLERGAMDTFYCEESKGWHIGHKSIRARLERD